MNFIFYKGICGIFPCRMGICIIPHVLREFSVIFFVLMSCRPIVHSTNKQIMLLTHH
jgi:hypothetical protein